MHDEPTAQRDRTTLDRRALLRGGALGAVTVPLLAACGVEGGGQSAAGGRSSVSISGSDVPVGGGTILEDAMVVVTQPAEGEFRAFSAICPHQGCPVQDISDGEIGCRCHGSAFSIADGSVLDGPAARPLEGMSVSVRGDQVTVS